MPSLPISHTAMFPYPTLLSFPSLKTHPLTSMLTSYPFTYILCLTYVIPLYLAYLSLTCPIAYYINVYLFTYVLSYLCDY